MPEKPKRPIVPKFKTEAEEAKWWFDNRHIVEGELIKAIKGGAARRGTAQRLAHDAQRVREAKESRNITIRMPLSEIERAQAMAEKRGIGYQTLMKMLLREALDREARRAR